MGKRAAPDEQPYRPLLDTGLVAAALAQVLPTKTSVDAKSPSTNGLDSGPSVLQSQRVQMRDRYFPEQSVIRSIPGTATVEKFDHEKRILFTRSETQSIDRVVTSLA